jgi:hypothetical protein
MSVQLPKKTEGNYIYADFPNVITEEPKAPVPLFALKKSTPAPPKQEGNILQFCIY